MAVSSMELHFSSALGRTVVKRRLNFYLRYIHFTTILPGKPGLAGSTSVCFLNLWISGTCFYALSIIGLVVKP